MTITLTRERQTGMWPFWRRTIKEVRTYRGHSTIWRDIETGQRAPTHIEAILADMAWHMKRQNT